MTDLDPYASPRSPEISELPASPTPTGPLAPAPTQPVERQRPPGTRAGARWRWSVALVIVALLVVATATGAVLLTGARAASTVARWAPSDALVYAELRPDLPGDQRDALAAFLSAFPGFSDRSILERKLGEVYDRLLSDATKGKQTYNTDIAPWFGGQLGVAVRPPAGLAGTEHDPPPMLLIATTTDTTKALAWFRTTAEHAGATVTAGEVGGTQLLSASAGGQTIAAAAPTGVLLVGDGASVRAAVSRAGSGGLAADSSFQAALAALPADALATAYVHVAALGNLLGQLSSQAAIPTPSVDFAKLLPAWWSVSLRAGSDALTLEAAMPKTSLSGSVPDGASALPGRLPASTIALADAHDAGQAVLDALGNAGATARAELDKALKPVGGLDALVGWLGESAAVVVRTGNGPLPGVVAIATDPKAAQAVAGSLANLATVAGLHPVDQAYAGHTITTVDLSSSAAAGTGVLPPEGTAKVAVSWTIAGDLVVVGIDPGFVKAVLDTKPGASLAQASGFAAVAGRLSSSTHALGWVDLAAVRDLLVSRMSAAERSRYQADVAPYVTPLSAIVWGVTHDGSVERARGLLVLERP